MGIEVVIRYSGRYAKTDLAYDGALEPPVQMGTVGVVITGGVLIGV